MRGSCLLGRPVPPFSCGSVRAATHLLAKPLLRRCYPGAKRGAEQTRDSGDKRDSGIFGHAPFTQAVRRPGDRVARQRSPDNQFFVFKDAAHAANLLHSRESEHLSRLGNPDELAVEARPELKAHDGAFATASGHAAAIAGLPCADGPARISLRPRSFTAARSTSCRTIQEVRLGSEICR